MKIYCILVLLMLTKYVTAQNNWDYVTDKGETLTSEEYCLHGVVYFQDPNAWNLDLKGRELDINNKGIPCKLKANNDNR